MSVGDIVEILKNDLFYGKVACGPKLASTAFFVDQKESMFIPGLQVLTPDVGYHPDIRIVFNFESTYVSATTISTGEGGTTTLAPKRLVEPGTLHSVAKSLAQFVFYYFEYSMTQGSSDNDQMMQSGIVDYAKRMASSTNEEEMNYFINQVVNCFISEVTVTRSRSQIGICSVVVKDNRRVTETGSSNYLFYNIYKPALTQLFVPMLPFIVWARGRFYKNFYFPIFHGYVNRVAFSSTQGFAFLTVEGKDVLELARVSYEMLNPAVIQKGEIIQQTTQQLNAKPMYGIDHMEVFHGMFHGGILADDPVTGTRTMRPPKKGDPGGVTVRALAPLEKSTETEGKHKPYEVVDDRYFIDGDFSILGVLRDLKEKPRHTISWGYNITPERVFSVNAPDIFNSSFLSRLEILKEIAGASFFELYVDGYGNIQYHPMRTGNDFLLYDMFYPTDETPNAPTDIILGGNKAVGIFAHLHIFPGVQVLLTDESLSMSKNLNIEELVTHYILLGQPFWELPIDSRAIDYYGEAVDEVALARFGYRRKVEHNRYFNLSSDVTGLDGTTTNFLKLAAGAYLKYSNGLLSTRSDEVIFRPELEVAMPVYFPMEREVAYIDSITHTIRIGETATTTVISTFGRHYNEPPVDMLSYIVTQDRLLKQCIETNKIYDLSSLKGVIQYQTAAFGANMPLTAGWTENGPARNKVLSYYSDVNVLE